MSNGFNVLSTRELNLLENKYPLKGNVVGKFNFTSVDATFLQSLLPPDLILVPQPDADPGKHPLLLMFNATHLETNKYLDSIAEASSLPLVLDYNEFIVMIPFVEFKKARFNERSPYCFLPVLYLDNVLAVLGGRLFWEFNKILASFQVTTTTYLVTTEFTDQPFFSSDFVLSPPPIVDTSLQNFRDNIPILQLPVIEYGIYKYVESIYKIEYLDVQITPTISTTRNISCRYLPNTTLQVPSILDNRFGGFSMKYNWALSYIRFIPV